MRVGDIARRKEVTVKFRKFNVVVLKASELESKSMIELGMITAPRDESVIARSVASLRGAGFGQTLHVFAEPGSIPVADPRVEMRYNSERLGCFKNYNHALTTLLAETQQPYVCVLLDDVIYARNLARFLEYTLRQSQGWFGYYALISIQHEVTLWEQIPEGWFASDVGWESWGGQFVMQTEVAKQMVQHPVYVDHLENYVRNQQIDACVSECFKRMELPRYLHVPSLAEHIGETSTLNHGPLTADRKGFAFDESRDCLAWIPGRA